MKPSAIVLIAMSAPLVAAERKDPFAELVRPTDPLTPGQERAAFHLPQGFEIQLVASEPDLRKPMNMQWDALGRLWITESLEYPFPAREGLPGRDTVRIFSDFGPDGRARKMEIFADGLNIPIGLYPFRTDERRWKCVVWSIPDIWLLEDTDGDGRADRREVLFGPLGWERDTHGNLASFRRGDDGWLYGTHGFNNESTLRGRDGSELRIQSGNTWRVRIDGSRVEGNTWGQVNPFGLCWDDRGNLFSADCHSSPIYQLLRGGWYPSFGRPHDGLGFAPQTIQHSHGSTAICAPMLIRDPAWPVEWQGQMLIGNVMTSRINRDAIAWLGSSSKGAEMPDFVTTDDPWFRPVDLGWGPDGALYIADFYNRIIGHYEVPLTHPGRDRERGRIWRVVYKGDARDPRLEVSARGGALPGDVVGLVRELGSKNPTRRTLALNELCDRVGREAIDPLKAALAKPVNAFQEANSIHALSRLGALDPASLAAAMAGQDPLVRTHALRVSREWLLGLRLNPPEGGRVTGAEDRILTAVRARLEDADGVVRRVAAEALAAFPSPDGFASLLDLLARTDRADDHLVYTTRVALRDHLRDPALAGKLKLDGLSIQSLQAVLDIMPAVPGEHAAALRLDLFEKLDVPAAEFARQIPSIVRNAPVSRLDAVAALARRKRPDDAALIAGILAALDARGAQPGDSLREWAGALVPRILSGRIPSGWINAGAGKSPWAIQERRCADGRAAQVMSSFPNGETLTGALLSASFAAPERLRFFLCGHDGFPGTPAGGRNFVRLVDAADGRLLREAAPPRNDVARPMEWDLADLRGRRVRFEATDGDAGRAYAWIAFGRFEPDLPELALVEPADRSLQALAADMAARFNLRENKAVLEGILAGRMADVETRAAAARALIAFARGSSDAGTDEGVSAVAAVLGNAAEPDVLRVYLASALVEMDRADVCRIVGDAMSGAPSGLQLSFATALAANRNGAIVLLGAIEAGTVSLVVLRDKGTVDRLLASGSDDERARLRALLARLPPANVEMDRLIADRRASMDRTKGDPAGGARIFQTHCAVCHSIEGKGGLIGPQLDGIGGRGADRLVEDILDPNRNVDRAFRTSIVTMKDGSVASGLFRREEGAQIVLADVTGREQSLPKANVKSREERETSLMPPAFGETIPPGDFNDLLAYLLGKRPAR